MSNTVLKLTVVVRTAYVVTVARVASPVEDGEPVLVRGESSSAEDTCWGWRCASGFYFCVQRKNKEATVRKS